MDSHGRNPCDRCDPSTYPVALVRSNRAAALLCLLHKARHYEKEQITVEPEVLAAIRVPQRIR